MPRPAQSKSGCRPSTSFLAVCCVVLWLGSPRRELRAEILTAPVQRFTNSPGQSVFPFKNLTFFKQFLYGWNPAPVGIGSIYNPPYAPGKDGAQVSFSTQGAFGFEFGLCLGGRVDFDLGFRPQITLPDRLATGFGLPPIVT